ncbi:MAG: hypothetical protein M3M85_01120 [bacterium]|nr:hypothetical protein [bacterium]
MFPEQIIFIGVAANLVGSFWYLREIIRGQTRPNLVSWVIWTLPPFIGVFLMLKAGAGLSFWGALAAGVTSLLVVAIALLKNNGYWKLNRFDLVCGAIALTSLLIYLLTYNLAVSILFAVMADSLAYIPTIRKSWKFPETESSSTYWGGTVNNAIALLIITNWSFAIYSFSVGLIIMNLTVIFCIYRKKLLNLI